MIKKKEERMSESEIFRYVQKERRPSKTEQTDRQIERYRERERERERKEKASNRQTDRQTV